MARQGIFTGFTPNDGLGDSLALGASKVNANFTEIYTTFGDGNNLSANAGSAGTWSKAGNSGIYTSKNVGIGTTDPSAALFVSGNVQLTGITTGTFVGDGSGLTGVTAVGQGVVIKDSGVLVGVAQSLNFDRNLDITQAFGGNVTVSAADTVGFAFTSGFSTTSAYANVAGVSTTSSTAGFADTATLALAANFATVAGIVTYASASGVATNAGVAEYAKVAGISSYTANAGFSTMAGYAHTAGIATVAQNLTGTPSITIDNINSSIGIATLPGQGSKIRFDFDATGDMPGSTSWRGMFAWANNTKTAYVSSGTTMGGYNGWRKILHQDMYGNYQTVGVITASKFSGDGSLLTDLPSTDSIWRANSTGIHTLGSVGIGTTNTEAYKLKVVGNMKLVGRLDGTAEENILPFLWSTYASLPSSSTYHGAFAHVHETGKAYFAHAGWNELVNKNQDQSVGTGTENYRVGVLTAISFTGDGSGLNNINVSFANTAGVATVAAGLTDKPDILVDNINATGIITAAQGFVGDGSGLTGITASGSGIIIRDDGTLVGTIGTINFGTNLTVSPASAGVVTVTASGSGGGGGSVFTTRIVGIQTDNVIPFYYDNYSDFPSSSTYHGAVAHSHDTGRLYFAHAGWKELVNREADGTVGTGTDNYRVGVVTGTSFAASSFISVGGNQITQLDITQYETAYAWGNHATAGYLTGIGGQNLGNLSNVSSNAPNANDVLTWSGSQWAPAAPTGGGGGGGINGITIKEEGTNVGTATSITSINFVGSGVTATGTGSEATVTITAVSGGGGGGISTTGFGTYTASAGVETQIDSFSAASYSGAEYTFMIGLGTYRQSQKVLVMHDGTTAFSQEYGIMFSPEQQVSIGATIDSGNVQIKFTPEAGISGLSTYRYIKTLIQGI